MLLRAEANISVSAGISEPYPLLAPCLQGLGKFSHLIDLDFMGDLINSLRKLASGGGLTVTERLRCCIVAFRVMKGNLDALNVDLQDFFVQLYNIILEYRPGRFVLNLILPHCFGNMICYNTERKCSEPISNIIQETGHTSISNFLMIFEIVLFLVLVME